MSSPSTTPADPVRQERAGEAMRGWIRSPDDGVCLTVLDRVEAGGWARPEHRADLESAAARSDWRIGAMALRSLRQLDLEETPPRAFRRLLRHKQWQVRLALTDTLSAYRSAEAVNLLIKLLGDKRIRVRMAAHRTLCQLVQQDAGKTQKDWVDWRRGPGKEVRFVPRDQRPPDATRDERYAQDDGGGGFFGKKILSDRVVFVLDKSESMYWGYFDQVVDEIESFVCSAGPTTCFTAIEYDELHRVWRTSLAPANAASARQVCGFLARSEPYGPTNVMDPLRTALKVEKADTIVLLSDGMPNRGIDDPAKITEVFTRENRHLRLALHTLFVVRGRTFPHNGPRGDARPPLTDEERTRQESYRRTAHNRGAGAFLQAIALANDGTFDVAFADYYKRDPSRGTGSTRPSSDK